MELQMAHHKIHVPSEDLVNAGWGDIQKQATLGPWQEMAATGARQTKSFARIQCWVQAQLMRQPTRQKRTGQKKYRSTHQPSILQPMKRESLNCGSCDGHPSTL